MAPEIIAAIIGGASSLAGAGVSAGSAAMANRRNYKWSKKYFEFQNEYNLNNYSPAMQMARLREAGLNPHEVTGTQSSSVGSMSMPEYQNPVDPNAIPNALATAWAMYQQKKNLENSTSITEADKELKTASAARATADAARIAYYNSMIQPWEAVSAKNKSEILKYGVGKAKLENQQLLNDISIFSLKKQKYQLGLDLLEIEKKYADEYYRLRNRSVGADVRLKSANAGMSEKDLLNYQQFGIRPNDPYYTRFGAEATRFIDNAIGTGKSWVKGFWNSLFHD